MNTAPKIIIFCSGKSSFQTIQFLSLEGNLGGIVCVNNDSSFNDLLMFCKQKRIPFFELKNLEALKHELGNWLEKLNFDACFCIGFPYKISNELLTQFPDRFINFHMGKLPDFRGPMPIFETLKAGEKETAVTIHYMNNEYDKGDIIFEDTFLMTSNDTFSSLAIKFSERIYLAAQNLIQVVKFGTHIPRKKQKDSSNYNFYPKKKDTSIRWEYMTMTEIIDLCNACNTWNKGADTILNNNFFKIIYATKTIETHTKEPGTVLSIENGLTKLACIDNEVLQVDIVWSNWGIEPANILFTRISKPGNIVGT